MERLTIRSKNSDMVWFKDAENGNAHFEPCEMTAHHNRMALDKLATYEDAEDQGFLLRLPISEDAPVYSIEYCCGKNKIGEVVKDAYERHKDSAELVDRITNAVSVYVLTQSVGYMDYLRSESGVVAND